MTKEISTQIAINATPEKIWNTLINTDLYSNWNPFIKTVEGTLKKNKQIKVTIQPSGGSKMSFKPVIICFNKHQKLAWQGKLFIKGIFDGIHSFELVPHNNGSTTFIHSEVFSGVLVRWINLDATKIGFESMNIALKELCESSLNFS